jgi:hypothetical protein
VPGTSLNFCGHHCQIAHRFLKCLYGEVILMESDFPRTMQICVFVLLPWNPLVLKIYVLLLLSALFMSMPSIIGMGDWSCCIFSAVPYSRILSRVSSHLQDHTSFFSFLLDFLWFMGGSYLSILGTVGPCCNSPTYSLTLMCLCSPAGPSATPRTCDSLPF